MMELAIRTQNLSCHFGEIKAVDDLSLQVPRGIVFGFLGPNGSGKTTTIRLLLGLLEAQQGEATVLGFDTRHQAGQIRAQAGALLEHTGLYERLSAVDNLEFYGRINRLAPAERKARIRQLLSHFDLWERRGDPVGTWSRGMKQKLAIARALLHRPAIIFLDEPTAGLDPVAAAALREDIAALVEQDGVTVFLNTHNLSEAEKLCTQVGVIHKGRLLTVGSPDQLRSQEDAGRLEIKGRGFTPELLDQLSTRPEVAALEKTNGRLDVHLTETAAPAALFNFLVRAGVEVDEFHKHKTDLEDVFLRMMEQSEHVE
jgi:ABC-2 type transport system ATP-binding protein